MIFTVDASVFISAAKPGEAAHSACVEFFTQAVRQHGAFECPTLLLVEIAAAMGRSTRDSQLSRSFVQKTQANPLLRLKPLDTHLAGLSADMALTHFVRGADAVYLAVAHEAGGALITLDEEMKQRGAAIVPSFTPSEWLRRSSVK